MSCWAASQCFLCVVAHVPKVTRPAREWEVFSFVSWGSGENNLHYLTINTTNMLAKQYELKVHFLSDWDCFVNGGLTQSTGSDALQTLSILFKLYTYNRLISLKKQVKKDKNENPHKYKYAFTKQSVFTWWVAYVPVTNTLIPSENKTHTQNTFASLG